MIGKGSSAHHYLNADLCYALWLTSGSVGRATRRLVLEGFRNPITLEKPSRMGVWFAAKRSEYYNKFVENRESGIIKQQTATSDEFDEAKRIIERLLPVEIEKNKSSIKETEETVKMHE